MGLNEAIENIKRLREEHRQAAQLATAERAIEAAENPPAAQYAGFDAKTGQAIARLPNGELVSGSQIFNSMPSAGDRVILDPATGRPFIDQVSAWQKPEPEPEPVAVAGKVKILYYTPDNKLWIGGDRAKPKAVGTRQADTFYSLTNLGDGDRWNIAWIRGDAINGYTIGWIGGRTIEIVNNAPAELRRYFAPIYRGQGYIELQAMKELIYDLSVAPGETVPTWNVLPDGTVGVSGAYTKGTDGTINGNSSHVSILWNKTTTQVAPAQSSQNNTPGASLYNVKTAAWVSPSQSKLSSDTTEGGLTDRVLKIYTSIQFGSVASLWKENVTTYDPTTEEPSSQTKYYFGDREVAQPPEGIDDTFDLWGGLAYETGIIDANGNLKIFTWTPGNPWTKKESSTFVYPIPDNAVSISGSYHP